MTAGSITLWLTKINTLSDALSINSTIQYYTHKAGQTAITQNKAKVACVG